MMVLLTADCWLLTADCWLAAGGWRGAGGLLVMLAGWLAGVALAARWCSGWW